MEGQAPLVLKCQLPVSELNGILGFHNVVAEPGTLMHFLEFLPADSEHADLCFRSSGKITGSNIDNPSFLAKTSAAVRSEQSPNSFDPGIFLHKFNYAIHLRADIIDKYSENLPAMFDLNGSGSDHFDPLVSIGIGGH